jgi:hypothetical protein
MQINDFSFDKLPIIFESVLQETLLCGRTCVWIHFISLTSRILPFDAAWIRSTYPCRHHIRMQQLASIFNLCYIPSYILCYTSKMAEGATTRSQEMSQNAPGTNFDKSGVNDDIKKMQQSSQGSQLSGKGGDPSMRRIEPNSLHLHQVY